MVHATLQCIASADMFWRTCADSKLPNMQVGQLVRLNEAML